MEIIKKNILYFTDGLFGLGRGTPPPAQYCNDNKGYCSTNCHYGQIGKRPGECPGYGSIVPTKCCQKNVG